MRTGKALILATREYAKDDSAQSWAAVASTALLLLVLALSVALLPYWFLKLPASVLLGMVMVRMFVIYHDHQHHAILPKSKAAKLLMRLWGATSTCQPLILVPSNVERKNTPLFPLASCLNSKVRIKSS